MQLLTLAAFAAFFSPLTHANVLQQCTGSHAVDGYQGNSYYVTVDQISSSNLGSACGACDSAIRDIASSHGVSYG